MCLILWGGEPRDVEIVAADFLMMKANEIRFHARVGHLLRTFAATDVTVSTEFQDIRWSRRLICAAHSMLG